MYSKSIEWGMNFGSVELRLNKIMDERNISINQMSKLADVKYDVVKRYYYNDNYLFSSEVLAKFCYILGCTIGDILVYVPSDTFVHIN